jgi:hypothetical protein
MKTPAGELLLNRDQLALNQAPPPIVRASRLSIYERVNSDEFRSPLSAPARFRGAKPSVNRKITIVFLGVNADVLMLPPTTLPLIGNSTR